MESQAALPQSIPLELESRIELAAQNDTNVRRAWREFRIAKPEQSASAATALLQALIPFVDVFLEAFAWLISRFPCRPNRACLLHAVASWSEETILRVGVVRLMEMMVAHKVSSQDVRLCTRLLELYHRTEARADETLRAFLHLWDPNAATGASWWLLGERPREAFNRVHAGMVQALLSPPGFLPVAQLAAMRKWLRRHKQEMLSEPMQNPKTMTPAMATSLVAARNQLRLRSEELLQIISACNEASLAAMECLNRGVRTQDPLNDPPILRHLLKQEKNFRRLAKALRKWAHKLPFEEVHRIVQQKTFPKSRKFNLYDLLLQHPGAPRLSWDWCVQDTKAPGQDLYVILGNSKAITILLMRKMGRLATRHQMLQWLPWLQLHSDAEDFLLCYYAPENARPPVPIDQHARQRFTDQAVFALVVDAEEVH